MKLIIISQSLWKENDAAHSCVVKNKTCKENVCIKVYDYKIETKIHVDSHLKLRLQLN